MILFFFSNRFDRSNDSGENEYINAELNVLPPSDQWNIVSRSPLSDKTKVILSFYSFYSSIFGISFCPNIRIVLP